MYASSQIKKPMAAIPQPYLGIKEKPFENKAIIKVFC
jgi:hypothetical protein